MATRGRREAEFVVDVDVIGQASVKGLAADVRALARDGGDAAPEFERLAREIEKIGQQGDSIALVQRLQTETDELRASTERAATAESELAAKVAAAAAATEKARTAFNEADAEQRRLVTSRNEQVRALALLQAETDKAGRKEASYTNQVRAMRVEIVRLQGEVEKAKNARREAQQVVAEATRVENAYTAQVTRAANEVTRTNTAFRERAQALQDAQSAAGRLGVDTQNLAAEQVRLAQTLQGATSAAQQQVVELDRLAADTEAAAHAQREYALAAERAERAMAEQIATLKQTEAALEAFARAQIAAISAGERDLDLNEQRLAAAQALTRSDENLSAAQRELANARNIERAATINQAQALQNSARAARESLAATQALVSEARSAARVLDDAFAKTGVRSLEALEAEVRETENALSLLERRFRAGAVSAQDLSRATGGAQLRLAQLQAEMQRIPSAPGVFERLSGTITGLANRFGALTAAVATFGYALKPIIDAEVELQRLRRVLDTVTGSSQTTAQTIEFLRDVAQQSGQSFSQLSGDFSKFAASAVNAGIPLETVMTVFQNAANAAGNLGLESAALGRILTALGQIASKGTVSMEELKGQLGESLPGALALTAQALGLTTAELTKLIESGNLTASVAIPAIGDAMTKLASKTGEVDGLTAAWNRFTNIVKEAGTNAAESPGGRALGNLIDGIGAAFTRLLEKANTASTYSVAAIESIAAAAALAVNGDLKDLPATLDEIWAKAAQQVENFRGRVEGAGPALDLTTLKGKELKAALDASAASADLAAQSFTAGVQAINSSATASANLATAQKAAAAAVEAAAVSAEKGNAAWARAAVDYEKATTAATISAQVADRLAQAKRTEAEAMVAVAELTGNEVTIAATRVQAAESVAAALRAQADADAALTAVYVSERDALAKLVETTGVADAGQAERLKKLNELIAAKGADAEKTKQQADAAERHSAALETQSLTLRDNSKNLDQWTKELNGARSALLELIRLHVEGKASAEQLAAAGLRLAQAEALVRDAMVDGLDALRAKNNLQQESRNVQLALLDAQRSALQSEIAVLEAQGRSYEATQKKIALKELEIKIIRATVEAKLAEVEATKAEIVAERELIASKRELTEAERLAFEARLKALEVRKLEAAAAKEQVKLLEEQIANLRRYGSETVQTYQSTSEAISGETAALDENTESWSRNASARAAARQGATGPVDASGFVLGPDGNRLSMGVIDSNYVLQQLTAAGFSQQEAYSAAREAGVIDSNGRVSQMGYDSVIEAIQAIINKRKGNIGALLPGFSGNTAFGSGGGGGAFGAGGGTTTPVVGSGGTNSGEATGGRSVFGQRTIVIDRGRRSVIDTTDEASARNLESLIRNLSEANDRTAG